MLLIWKDMLQIHSDTHWYEWYNTLDTQALKFFWVSYPHQYHMCITLYHIYIAHVSDSGGCGVCIRFISLHISVYQGLEVYQIHISTYQCVSPSILYQMHITIVSCVSRLIRTAARIRINSVCVRCIMCLYHTISHCISSCCRYNVIQRDTMWYYVILMMI